MKTTLLIILLVPTVSATGQISNYSRDVGSYIIGNQKDTIEAAFIFPSADVMPFGDTLWIQDQISIAHSQRSMMLYPGQLSGFCYNGNYYEALWWAEDTPSKPQTITRKFCKQVLAGIVPVFSCNEVVPDNKGYTVRTALYYKLDDEYRPASLFNFQCAVSRHKPHHRALAQRVMSGNFRNDEFLAIVEEYNKYLEPKTSH